MKKFFKVLALALAVCFVVACFTGCKKDRRQSDDLGKYTLDEDGNRVYKLVMYDHGFTLPDKPEYREEVLAAINEKVLAELGYKVDLEVRCFPDDQFDTKINTELAAGTEIDLIRIGSRDTLVNYVNQEMLTDLSEEVPSLDQMNAYLSAKNKNLWLETSVGGKVYGIPSPAFTCYRGSWVRGDYLVKAGIKDADGKSKVPSTMEELETALAALSKEGIMDGRKTVAWAGLLAEIEGLLLGNFTETPGDFVDANGDIMPKYFDPGYKAFIKKLNEWYRKGYVDDQLFNATYDGVNALMRDGATAIAGTNIWGLEWGSLRSVDTAHPEYDIKFMGYLDDAKAYQSTGFSTDILIVPYTSVNYKVMLQFLNWAMYNKDNYSLVYNGLEGKTFVYDGEATTVPPAYQDDPTKSMPTNIMGKFLVGGNVEYNIQWTPDTVPSEARRAYDLCLGMDTADIYVPPTTYTNTVIADEIGLKKSTADNNMNSSIQAIIKDKTLTEEQFDAQFAKILAKYREDGGLEAYQEYTKVYKTLNLK